MNNRYKEYLNKIEKSLETKLPDDLNDIVQKAMFGPITPEVPASILQLHPNVTVIYSEN